MHRQLLISSLIVLLSLFNLLSFSQGRQRFDSKMDSVFITNTSIYYDNETGEEQRTVMGRDVIVLKDNGRIQESYRYTFTPQHHIGIVKDPAKTVLTFDKLGRLTEIFAYFTNGKPWTREVYTYSESGLSGEAKGHYLPDDTPANSSSGNLTLDEHANIVKTEIAAGRIDSPLVIYYVYDEKNQVIREEWHRVGSPMTTLYNRKYDKNSNLVEESSTFIRQGRPNETKVTTFGYERFDSHNNWLVQNTYVDGKLRGRKERRITYHK